MQNTHRLTNKDRNIIRRHMIDYYEDRADEEDLADEYDLEQVKKKLGKKRLTKAEKALLAIEKDGKSAYRNPYRRYGRNKLREGQTLAEKGRFFNYIGDIYDFIAKIYGEKQAEYFGIFGILPYVYNGLIGREYKNMLNDFEKGKPLLKTTATAKKKTITKCKPTAKKSETARSKKVR